MRGVYEALAFPDFGHVEPALQCYLAGIAGNRKNALPELPTDLRAGIAGEWRRCDFDPSGHGPCRCRAGHAVSVELIGPAEG